MPSDTAALRIGLDADRSKVHVRLGWVVSGPGGQPRQDSQGAPGAEPGQQARHHPDLLTAGELASWRVDPVNHADDPTHRRRATSLVPFMTDNPVRKKVSLRRSTSAPNAATWRGLVTNARARTRAASGSLAGTSGARVISGIGCLYCTGGGGSTPAAN